MTIFSQRNFTAGEISPDLYGRADTVRYQNGLKKCRNTIVSRYGALTNRPGTEFVSEVKDSTKEVRLIPFAINQSTADILEFGDGYIRVIYNGGLVLEASKNITGATKASPIVITCTSHGYSNGDEVYIESVGGMTQLNTRHFLVANVTTNTFTLQYKDGTDVDSTSFTTYTSGGTVSRVYSIVSPYTESDLPDINYVQNNSELILVHSSYPPKSLVRSGQTSWALSDYSFVPTMSSPSNLSGTPASSGSVRRKYRVTAINSTTFEESLPGYEPSKNITGATKANPVVITCTSHGYSNGDEVYINNVGGMTQLNDNTYTVANVTTNTFELSGINGSAYTTYTSGGTVNRTFLSILSAASPTSTSANTVSWTAVSGASQYNIYRETNGIYGLIGIASGTSYSDIGVDPDTTTTPPSKRNPFASAGNYPKTVAFIQQRITFASTINEPDLVEMSRIGLYKNFTYSNPIQDDDAIRFKIAGTTIIQINNLLDLTRLIILTTGGEYVVEGDSSGLLTPTSIHPSQVSNVGSNTLTPIKIGTNALFVQDKGNLVKYLKYNLVEGYSEEEISLFGNHLLDKYTIKEVAYQQYPNSCIWFVRTDGVLIGCTFIKEQEIVAFHRHDFDGFVENIVAIDEGSNKSIYLTIRRQINGRTVRYIERMINNVVDPIIDCKILDCCLTYNGLNTNNSLTMTVSGGVDWTNVETLTLTASSSFFSSSDVGNSIFITKENGENLVLNITGYTSATVVSVVSDETIPVNLRNTASSEWAKAVNQITNLWHLEGKSVSVFADGYVESNPNNPDYDINTVENGQITLTKNYAVIHVGLPISSEIITLDIENVQGESFINKKKRITQLSLNLKDTRGLFVGPQDTNSDTDFSNMYELKDLAITSFDDAKNLLTGYSSINFTGNFSSSASVFIRQTDPLPFTILGIHPTGSIGG